MIYRFRILTVTLTNYLLCSRHVNAPFRTPLLLIPWVKAEKDAAHHTAPAKHDPSSEKVRV